MNNPELRATMGRAGRERAVEHYDYRAVARQLVSILNQRLGIS
jgi:glycosyltransferase involved in cell wall biosynthesis